MGFVRLDENGGFGDGLVQVKAIDIIIVVGGLVQFLSLTFQELIRLTSAGIDC